MTPAAKPLPRLDWTLPPGTQERIADDARDQARTLTAAASGGDMRRAWLDAGGKDITLTPDVEIIMRGWHEQHLRNRLAREGTARAVAAHRDHVRQQARETLAAIGITGPAAARPAWEDTRHHAEHLRATARLPAGKAAATRAQTRLDRLEAHLIAAGLADRDDDDPFTLTFDERTPA